ncbi:MAG TPA: nicotinate-nucleotide--dimethylbenzimidazole phosphoribosyltransferase [Acidimicrobiales bacterium]
MTAAHWSTIAASVPAVSERAAEAASRRHLTLAKPPGSLGVLETVGARLAAIAGASPPPLPVRPAVALFAADHGILARGVTPWPQAVTARMVETFAAGGAGINAICASLGIDLTVIDVGVASPYDAVGVWPRAVRAGTRDMSVVPALSADEVNAAIDVGVEVAESLVAGGADLLVGGEMGIGNTSATSALAALLLGTDPGGVADLVGPGAGVPDDFVEVKRRAVATAVERARASRHDTADPVVALAEVGGLEIAALVGLYIGAASLRVPAIVDGAISDVAALCAVRLQPAVGGYLFAGHRSTEPAATQLLDALDLVPLLDLGLRLGEGTGGALAVPVVRAAAAVLAEMTLLEDLGFGPG